MGGCIAVACGDTGRFSSFSEALARLDKPPDTHVYFSKGSDRETSRNVLVRAMLDSGDDWLLFLDDDNVFAGDLLVRLLARNVDLVGGLYLRRDRPFSAIAYGERLEDGRFIPLDLSAHGKDDLVPVLAVGTGAMLVRRRVFEGMSDPWFRRAELTEDLLFCLECGHQPHVDLGARVGHMTTATVWPSVTEDEWTVGVTVTEQVNFLMKLS